MKIVVFVFCLLPFLINAQVPIVRSKTVRSIYVMPDFTSLNYTDPKHQEAWMPKAGIAVGVQLKLKVNNSFFLRVGAGYGLKGYRNMEVGLRLGSNVNPMTGYITESKIETKGEFHEFQLPLAFQYDFNGEDFFIAVGADLVGQVGHTTKRQVFYGDGTSDIISYENKSQWNTVPTISIGYTFPINYHYNLSIAPTFRIYGNEWILKDSRLYSYGIKFLLDFKP